MLNTLALETITSTDEWFYLFSTITSDYAKKYESFCEAKRNYSSIHGYYYENDINKLKSENITSIHPTDLKILAIDYLLSGNSTSIPKPSLINDNKTWFVFLDGDAIVGEKRIPLSFYTKTAMNFTKSVQKTIGGGEECHFIAQTDGTAINSGFWMIRNSTWSRDFVSDWKDSYFNLEVARWQHVLPNNETVLNPNAGWTHDQGALMNTILRVRRMTFSFMIDELQTVFNYIHCNTSNK